MEGMQLDLRVDMERNRWISGSFFEYTLCMADWHKYKNILNNTISKKEKFITNGILRKREISPYPAGRWSSHKVHWIDRGRHQNQEYTCNTKYHMNFLIGTVISRIRSLE